jgi:apolipoprotein N-acyltransferase
LRNILVDQDLQANPNKNKHFIIKFIGFCVSTAIIYFMVIWTIELSKVEIEDLPVISVLNDNFKISAKNSHSDIENLNLSINILKEGKFQEKYKNLKLQNTIEPNLLEEEKAVSLDMEEALQNSIYQALKSLENQEVILSEKSFYLYLGSFEDQNSANKKLSEINKIDQINLIANFSVIKKITKDNKNSYSVVSRNNFFHEKALDYCIDISSHNLECKIILDL